MASVNNNLEIVEKLIAAKADVNVRDKVRINNTIMPTCDPCACDTFFFFLARAAKKERRTLGQL